jgi:hypothetical protein
VERLQLLNSDPTTTAHKQTTVVRILRWVISTDLSSEVFDYFLPSLEPAGGTAGASSFSMEPK